MAGSINTPNTFASQSGPIPLSQLDTNFSTIATALNTLQNFDNYYADGGTTNAIAITVSSPQIVAYGAGLLVQVKVAFTNTGATTLNINGLGGVAIITSSGSALGANTLIAGGIYQFQHDGTYFQIQTQSVSVTGAQINAALGYTAGYINVPQNAKTANYTLAATDVGKHISITTGGVNVPVSVFSPGDIVTVFNNSGTSQTITQNSGATLRLAGTATTGSRTLAQYGVATILCIVGGATPTFVVTGAGVT